MDMNTIDLKILKARLSGVNLKNLIISKGLKKYRIAKDCGLTYRTILNWAKEKAVPKDENAIIVGRYLGLIKSDEADRLKLRKEIDKLSERLQRLE